jgi:hypothetical protein
MGESGRRWGGVIVRGALGERGMVAGPVPRGASARVVVAGRAQVPVLGIGGGGIGCLRGHVSGAGDGDR